MAGKNTFEWDEWNGRDARAPARQAVRMRRKPLVATVLVGAVLGTAWAGLAPAIASAAVDASASNRGWTTPLHHAGAGNDYEYDNNDD